ncbi:hypothetical protein CC86DRAFT_336159 [Ophiobolus disseminans]|uniref:Uncharacterized protein n=1 Tax=Ophiobolus disseminans TaxID=1469910 RepID=A0A6A6ZE25_9PLEO|nr:hypothetical protein CC86DRAFT_336159 [Ophiobolus disseminans]
MVLRLFVPPGEGQHKLVPRRPDPIGANATLQYSIIGSTALAATYTSLAVNHGQRVSPAQPISRTTIFIRSSARLGLWAGVVGAAINWYYHTAFVGVVASEFKLKLKPWKLYKWTKRRTVEDGCLAGAALGLAASIPTLFTRRPAIPRWTRVLGMTNIGACAGILGGHGYFAYTGERQKAYKRLDQRLKRRSLEFYAIFWNKELMACFNPLVQQYIRHNGIWYTYHLPDEVYDDVDAYGKRIAKKQSPDTDTQTAEQPQEAHFKKPIDYVADLRQFDVDFTRTAIAEQEVEKENLLKEAEYLFFVMAQKEYEYCRIKDMDDDERQRRQHEIQVLQFAYNNVRSAVTTIETRLLGWTMSLRHRALLDADQTGPDDLKAWLPASASVDCKAHDPTLSIQEMERLQAQIGPQVKQFEELVAHPGYERSQREQWKRDIEDGRRVLRALDSVVWELEKRRKALEGKSAGEGTVKELEQQMDVGKVQASPTVNANEEKTTEKDSKDKQVNKVEVKKSETGKPPNEGLDPDKS